MANINYDSRGFRGIGMLRTTHRLLAAVSCVYAQASLAAPAAPPNAIVNAYVSHSVAEKPGVIDRYRYDGFVATSTDFAIVRSAAQPSPYVAVTAITKAINETSNIQSTINYFLTVDAGDSTLSIPFIVTGNAALEAFLPDVRTSSVFGTAYIGVYEDYYKTKLNVGYHYEKKF